MAGFENCSWRMGRRATIYSKSGRASVRFNNNRSEFWPLAASFFAANLRCFRWVAVIGPYWDVWKSSHRWPLDLSGWWCMSMKGLANKRLILWVSQLHWKVTMVDIRLTWINDTQRDSRETTTASWPHFQISWYHQNWIQSPLALGCGSVAVFQFCSRVLTFLYTSFKRWLALSKVCHINAQHLFSIYCQGHFWAQKTKYKKSNS